jgi:hypothetical protein
MIGKNAERWKVVCEMAATEQDPDKLRALVHEIDALLGAKQHRLDDKARADRAEAEAKKNDSRSKASTN